MDATPIAQEFLAEEAVTRVLPREKLIHRNRDLALSVHVSFLFGPVLQVRAEQFIDH